MWLWECGFKYDGDVFDTMLVEYIMLRGQKKPLSLEACAERYSLHTQKKDTLKEYFKKGLGVDDVPKEELSEYLSADLNATKELSDALYKNLMMMSIVVLLLLLIIPIVLPLLLLIYISVGLMWIQNLLNKYNQSLKKKS